MIINAIRSVHIDKTVLNKPEIHELKKRNFDAINKESDIQKKMAQLLQWHNFESELTNKIGAWQFVRGLQVHHKYYIKGKMPWQYPDDALITFCEACHKEIHNTNLIPIYNLDETFCCHGLPCEKCNGTGYLPEYFYHKAGVCFKCMGSRFINVEI